METRSPFWMSAPVVVLLAACGGDPPIDAVCLGTADCVVTVGPVTVTVPAGAIPSGGLNLTATAATNPPTAATLLPGTAIDIGPDGTTFSPAATVAFVYDPTTLQAIGGLREQELGIYKVVNGAWQKLASSSVNVATNTITASITSLSVYGVLGEPAASVTVAPAAASIKAGETQQFVATVADASGSPLPGRQPTWSSADAGVSTINAAGLATGVSPGTTAITASVEGIQDVANLTVTPAASQFVILDPVDGPAGSPITVTIQAQDAAGVVVNDEGRDVTLSTDGSATGGGLVDVVNGIGATIVSDDIPETVTLTLSDTEGTGLDVSSTQDVQFLAGPPTQFVIVDPVDGQAGTPITVTIEARDGAGFLATQEDRDVTLIAGGSATGAGLVDIVNGTGTIEINDNVAEIVGLSLSDTEGTGLDVSSVQNVVFAAGAATKFVILDPANTVAGANLTITVQAQDPFGNVDVNENRDVTLVADGSATGAGLINVVAGVGMIVITDAVAETVNLSLMDTEGTGLDVTSVQDVQFDNPPPPTGEPTFRPGTDTMMWSEDFDNWTSNSDFATNSGNIIFANLGNSWTLDNQFSLGAQSLRLDWAASPCGDNQLPADGNMGFSRGGILFADPGNRNWVISWEAAYDPGFDFNWLGVDPTCSGRDKKILLVKRQGDFGRLGFHTLVNDTPCPDLFGIPKNNGEAWASIIERGNGSTEPGATFGCLVPIGIGDYKQHLALDTHRPADMADGQFHRYTIWIRKESTLDAGDGMLKVWIDGVLVLDYDGEDPLSPAFGAVFTRTEAIVRLEFAGILNRRSPSTQSEWFDDIQFWYRPD